MRIGRYKDMRITVWRDQNFDRYRDRDFLSETNFSDTNTETFFPRPNFPRPIPRLFFRDQIFQYRYRDFFNETKFFDTDTETFFSRPKLLIPIPRLSKNCHGSRDWDRNFCIWLTTVYRQLLANFSTFLCNFFRDQIPIPIPRLFRDLFSDTDTETTKELAKVSRPGSLETEMSHSNEDMRIGYAKWPLNP